MGNFIISDGFLTILWGLIALTFLLRALISSDSRNFGMFIISTGIATDIYGVIGSRSLLGIGILAYLFAERRESK
jgi:hypothetical protein